MRIEFNKKIEDYLSMNDCVLKESSREEYGQEGHREIVHVVYDLDKFIKLSTDRFEESLSGKKFNVYRPGNDSLLVTNPQRIIISFRIVDLNRNGCPKNHLEELGIKETGPKKGLSKKLFGKIVHKYREKPRVILSGKAVYTASENNEPEMLLETIQKLGYSAWLFPTRKELEEAYLQGREDQKTNMPLRKY